MPSRVRLHDAHLSGIDDAVAGHAAPLHQLAAAAHVAEAGQVAGDDDADAEAARFTDFGKPDTGREAVHVQDVGTLLGQKAVEPFGATDRNAVVRLVARRRAGDRVAEHRHAVVFVAFGRGVVRVGRGDQHVVTGGAQAAAERLDVHLGAADAVGKIPAEQVNDLHARFASRSNTFTQPSTTSSHSASVNAAEIGSRMREAATRSVTGRSTAAMSGELCA